MTNVYGEQEIIHDEWNRECEWALTRLCITGSVSSLRSGSHFCVKINTIQTFRWIFEDTQLPDGVAFSLADLSPHTHHAPYLPPARLVLLSVSSLLPKQASIFPFVASYGISFPSPECEFLCVSVVSVWSLCSLSLLLSSHLLLFFSL